MEDIRCTGHSFLFLKVPLADFPSNEMGSGGVLTGDSPSRLLLPGLNVGLTCMIDCAGAGLERNYVLQIIGIFGSTQNCAPQNKWYRRLCGISVFPGSFPRQAVSSLHEFSLSNLLFKWLSRIQSE